MPEPFVHVPGASVNPGQQLPLGPDDDHHLRRVLRRRDGDPLVVGDGRGAVADARLTPAGVGVVGPVVHEPRPAPRIHVVQALIRKVDDVVRVLTELGVDTITVVATERSVVRLDGDKADRARDRWSAVARSAAAQARRAWLPEVEGPVDLDALVGRWTAGGEPRGVVAHVGADRGLRMALEGAPWGRDEVVAAIGPEGGWTGDEVARLVRHGLRPASLGPSVVRTEHAGTVLATVLAYVVARME